jgi:hypothetical protein
MVPRVLAERFYDDLKGASPLISMAGIHCMKIVSFGSALTIGFGGEPDLSCGDGGNTIMGNLIRDVNEIVALFRRSVPEQMSRLRAQVSLVPPAGIEPVSC